ncbi:ferredoxin [Mycobacterium ahvazicum]|uniref:Ferredoxin n=1 Tax=Mycobacterium ahvazicum TaxID=1964395 RepID=A0A2K4YB28_9MYCO|nr:ferredoxin [Mycobacterium ahvazicum]SOX53982.1 ferredoxin [Mycobacterium ahvazicum]
MWLNSPVQMDNRLDEMPMLPVACGNCGAQVLVRKSTWNQTSVQWDADATRRCAQRAEAVSAHANRGVFLVCSALRESILDAVRQGELAIVDETEGSAPQAHWLVPPSPPRHTPVR